MKKTVSNPVMYEAFAGMCKIAKEEGGVMHKVMAIDMGIEFSVFSKLLTGKRPISEHYAAKIYKYFSDAKWASYGPSLVKYICDRFKIPATSLLYRKMAAKEYKDLVSYLFFELKLQDIGSTVDLLNLFLSYLKKYLKTILEEHSGECDGYRIINDDSFQKLEKDVNLPQNCVITVGQPSESGWVKRICILICPYQWDHERMIFDNPLFIETFKNCMVIRLREERAQSLCTMDKVENFTGATAEFETIYTGRLCSNAKELAEIIFKKICRDLLS